MGVRNSSFTAIANDANLVEGNYVELIVGGTFVGTIQLQVAIPGAAGADLWVPVGTSLTAPGVISVVFGQCRKVRAACTAYTSGTAYYSVGGSCNEDFLA